jgi:hypothetical protein
MNNIWKVTAIVSLIVIVILIILFIWFISIGSQELKKEQEIDHKLTQLDSKCYNEACVDSYYYDYDPYEGKCYCYDELGNQTKIKQYPYLKINMEE